MLDVYWLAWTGIGGDDTMEQNKVDVVWNARVSRRCRKC